MEVINITQIKTHQSVSISPPKQKQSYAPFISKCPRFSPNNGGKQIQRKQSDIKLQKTGVKENIIHESRVLKGQQKSKIQNKQYCIFKSNISRFNKQTMMQTPSPGEYDIVQPKKIKNLEYINAKLNKLKKTLSKSTLPTIPDKRNRYGIDLEVNKVAFIEKTLEQIHREKQLMYQYKQTLSQEKLSKQIKTQESHPQNIEPRKIEEKIKSLLCEKQNIEQQPQKRLILKKVKSLKPKIHHLYEFHEKIQKYKPWQHLFPLKNKSKQKKMTRYQFFNSSEKRFKNLAITEQLSDSNNNHSIREYLDKLIKIKANFQEK